MRKVQFEVEDDEVKQRRIHSGIKETEQRDNVQGGDNSKY